MADTLYFDRDTLPAIQVELLMQILGYQKVLASLAASDNVTYARDMIDKLASDERDKILTELYVQYGKTPDV